MSREVPEPARYFPVEPADRRLKPGLHPFVTDFGNGTADALHFQTDREYEHYIEAKACLFRSARIPAVARDVGAAERHAVLDDSPRMRRAHDRILPWLAETIERERPANIAARFSDTGSPARSRYDALLRFVQEDAVVLLRDPAGRDRAVMVHVCFPSNWRPETISGRSFRRIHAPVPDFAKSESNAAGMVRAMIDQGPFVRFVWTVCADDRLDHHPEQQRRAPWNERTREGWLRVERQLTVPFAAVDAGLFLIRTYLYPFASLTPDQRATLAAALQAMPERVARYKGLADCRQYPCALLH